MNIAIWCIGSPFHHRIMIYNNLIVLEKCNFVLEKSLNFITEQGVQRTTTPLIGQWKNSPFIGQQVGNCKFHIDPLLGRSICHALWPKVNPIVHPTSYPTQIPFIPSELTLPFLSYGNFNILPWKSQVKVMGEVKVWSHIVSLTFYRLTSFSFHVNQPSHSWNTTFQNLTLKIQGQGHGRGEHWKSHHGSNILSTHIHFAPCQSAIPFIRYDFLKIWPWKSKVKVMGEGNSESHNMGPTFYRLTSL